MIKNININVGYDEILENDSSTNWLLPKANLSELDIDPPWLNWYKENQPETTRKWKKIAEVFDNIFLNFTENTIEHFISKDLSFIYPIFLLDNSIFQKYETVEFKNDLIDAVKRKKARIIFFQITESYFGTTDNDFEWMDNLASRYGFNKEDLVMVTTNLTAVDFYKNNKFTIYSYSYCNNQINFLNMKTLDNVAVNRYKTDYLKHVQNNKLNKKELHFLCFNGIPRENRVSIFAQIKVNPNLLNKSILSLRGTEWYDERHFYNLIKNNINEDYKYDKQALLNFYENYNSKENSVFDIDDLSKLDGKGGTDINKDAHTKTFVNIVTETHFIERSIFLTEKTFKPIYMCQPFIIFGSPNHLKKLKDLGFKTFDKWWDESYDQELDFTKRLEKVIELMENISTWSLDKCYEVTQEMEEVLIHNFKRLCNNNSDMHKLYEFLQTDMKPKKNLY
jgi:hypothetical protein